MSFAVAVRIVAMGVLLVAITACGGGGGSGSKKAPANDGVVLGALSFRPNVALPEIAVAHQKALTPDNSKSALVLALNSIRFIEGGSIPASPAVDFYADTFATSVALSKASHAYHKAYASSKVVDVSNRICASGSASMEGEDSLIGTKTLYYRNCNTGDTTYDGDLKVEVRSLVNDDVLTDTTLTFRDLRITDAETDSVFDGVVVMTTALPGAGFMAANLDVRDLIERKGIRVVDYRADFDIANPSYVYTVRQLRGRIYDDEGEYFDLGLTPEHAPWPMLVGKNSRLTLSPSGIPAPYQVRIALDATGDNIDECWLFAALNVITTKSIANDNAPEFHFDTTPIRLNKGEKREVRFGDVMDADQQFVSLSWQLMEKPMGSNPAVDAFANSFAFSSSVPGDYHFTVTASDGERTTAQNIDIRVMYDMPELAISGPSVINSGAGANFSLNILNPLEGTIRVAPLALPGLIYDDASLTAMFTPVLPEFGVDQQINVGFVVGNEDHQQTVTVPLTVRVLPDASSPVLITGNQYGESLSQDWVGQFTPSVSKEIIQKRDFLIDVFEVEGVSKRYIESYDLSYISGGYELTVLAASDVDGDGFDEILFGVKANDGRYHLGIYDAHRHRSMASAALTGVELSDMTPKIVDVANLNASGGKEVVFFTGTQLYVFDSALHLKWQSEPGSYGASMIVANVDNDAALELIIGSGYIFDGATYALQQQGDFFSAVGDQLFAADLDGNGIAEIYQVSNSGLQRMTSTGYVAVATDSGIYSTVVVRNIDDDPADELVLVTMTANAQPNLPPICFWGGFEGMLSLAYLELVNGNYTVHRVRDFDRGCSTSENRLIAHDVDGAGDLEYILNFASFPSREFIYRQNSDTILPMGFVGPQLVGSFSDGAQISAVGSRLAFCGMLKSAPDGPAAASDIFTLDLADGRIDADFSWIPANENLQARSTTPRCTSIRLDNPNRFGILSIGPVWDTVSGQIRTLINFLDADDGESIAFETLDDADQQRSVVADIDGDGNPEVVIAGSVTGPVSGRTEIISAFDLNSGELRRLNSSFDGQSISRLAAGDLMSVNNRDEIVVLINRFIQKGCALQVIAYDSAGEVQSKREKVLPEDCRVFEKPLIADVDGDGRNEILIRRVEYDGTGSAMQYVEVLDSELRVVTTWSMSGMVATVVPLNFGAGATLLATLEQASNGGKSSMVWRNGLDGHVIYQSPALGSEASELNFIVDPSASKIRAVIVGDTRIYLTQ